MAICHIAWEFSFFKGTCSLALPELNSGRRESQGNNFEFEQNKYQTIRSQIQGRLSQLTNRPLLSWRENSQSWGHQLTKALTVYEILNKGINNIFLNVIIVVVESCVLKISAGEVKINIFAFCNNARITWHFCSIWKYISLMVACIIEWNLLIFAWYTGFGGLL